MSICDEKWKYINEGNVHIVLNKSGTDTVIRLIKEENKPLNLSIVTNSVNYVNKIMIPMIFGKDKNYYEEIIKLTYSEILELSKDLDNWRPNHRKVKSKISLYAITAPNLTMINMNGVNYCLEIKPKEGFISKSLKKYSKCHYCIKQYTKLANNEIKSISNYCPLDFFSGNTSRMKYALLSLIEHPQNNFKVFKNGTIVFGDITNQSINSIHTIMNEIFHPFNTFLDFIITILLCDKSNTMLKRSDEQIYTKLEICDERNDLNNRSFLHKLLSVQQLAEGLNVNAESNDHDFEYVSQILKNLDSYDLNLSNSCDREQFLQVSNARELALISAVAKDCSLMISFTLDTEKMLPYIIVNGRPIYYRLSVTDLEPKPAKTLKKREDAERKLIQVVQPQAETRTKQLEAWEHLITEFFKSTKQSAIDIREIHNISIFNNEAISRKLSQESILIILEHMAKNGKAAPIDKSKNVWEVYWHSLDEWGNMVYDWVSSNGMNNTVCTIFELREGENTVGEEFHNLDMNVLMKALKTLEVKGKCEIMQFDDKQGVKFF